jgi:hypothetical protein
MARPKGNFWPQVRQLIWEKAEALFMQEQTRTWDIPTKPEHCELREEGYFQRAKIIVLRNLYYQKKGKNTEDPEDLTTPEMKEVLKGYDQQNR